jgi:replicative DNA helicase
MSEQRNSVLPERDYEADLLGLVIFAGKGEAVETILSDMQPADWLGRGGVHRWAFEAIRNVHRNGDQIDFRSVLREVRRMGHQDDVTAADISNWTNGMTHMRDWRQAVSVVRDASIRARVMEICKRTIVACTDAAADAPGVLSQLEHSVFAFNRELDSDNGGLVHIGEIIAQHRPTIEKAIESGDVDGVPSGFPSLDEYTRGFRPGELVVIAGRTSAGKTAFALNVIRNMVRDGRKIAIFSAEMGHPELLRRFLSMVSGVDGHQMFSGKLPEREWPKVGNAFGSMVDWPLWIDESADLTPGMIRSRARALKAQHGLDVVFVDYLQLLRGDGRRYDNRTAEVADVARTLKVLAKQIGVPIVALSQLNRDADRVLGSGNSRAKNPLQQIDAEQEKVAPPRLSQLAESSELEKAANFVIFLHRPSKGTLVYEVDIAKSRNGPTGTIELRWEKACMRFHECVVERRYSDSEAV